MSDWPPVDHKTAEASCGLDEAAESNRTIWISADQVEEIVFLMHETDVIEQTYGNVAGKKNLFFIRFSARHMTDDVFEVEPVTKEDYKIFGPNTGIMGSTETFTERMLFSLKHEFENSKKMLFRKGKMTTPNKSVTTSKSKEAWYYLKNNLPSFLFTSNKRTKIKRELPHTNLSMSSNLYNATIQTLTAKSVEDYTSCREVLSALYGVGIRKTFPNKADVHNNQKNPIPLATHDIINVVDLSLADDLSLELDSDVDFDRFGSGNGNFLRWQWNPVSRFCTTTIRCSPIVVSCNSDAIISFLERFKIDVSSFNSSFVGWQIGTRIFGEGKQFQITSINRSNDTATISAVTSRRNVSAASSKEVTFELLRDNFHIM